MRRKLGFLEVRVDPVLGVADDGEDRHAALHHAARPQLEIRDQTAGGRVTRVCDEIELGLRELRGRRTHGGVLRAGLAQRAQCLLADWPARR